MDLKKTQDVALHVCSLTHCEDVFVRCVRVCARMYAGDLVCVGGKREGGGRRGCKGLCLDRRGVCVCVYTVHSLSPKYMMSIMTPTPHTTAMIRLNTIARKRAVLMLPAPASCREDMHIHTHTHT